eukprot:CAMPEP_0172379346 /NCGR_PEP_ID=MMETSP1060-20121228/69881_1 /TAXON_ID=37318 /ORGANISM="Pseudo-nitzschia pungens, Strain cf. cingulata" /LENGTH=519 /DNA_ID=CAMNT_0013107087 /DNA_START=134 /DNA_END=1695 /DNA_ORIENTATION=+
MSELTTQRRATIKDPADPEKMAKSMSMSMSMSMPMSMAMAPMSPSENSLSLSLPNAGPESEKGSENTAPNGHGHGHGHNSSSSNNNKNSNNKNSSGGISAMGLKVLILLAVQQQEQQQQEQQRRNLRHGTQGPDPAGRPELVEKPVDAYVMKERPKFLTSAAVIGSEMTKLSLSLLYILFIEKKSVGSIVQYFRDDWKNSVLVAVPASAYNLQMTLEYIALANLDAAMFSVLVQTKLLFTATFSAAIIGKKLRYIQVISLTLLTVGVMLCNMKFNDNNDNDNNNSSNSNSSNEDVGGVDSNTKGILATLGIAVSSGFASVYTEKVIKSQRVKSPVVGQYSLAYTQVQLASMSLLTIGIYACIVDFKDIITYGLFYNFNAGAFLTVFNSALGGLIVAGVLKYADSVLKGYATAISVIGTGLMSMVLFGTKLHAVYFLGIVNVVIAVLLYNGKNFDQFAARRSNHKNNENDNENNNKNNDNDSNNDSNNDNNNDSNNDSKTKKKKKKKKKQVLSVSGVAIL